MTLDKFVKLPYRLLTLKHSPEGRNQMTYSERIAAVARRVCRIPRLTNINTIAFRRATNLCGTSWEPGTASKRQRSLRRKGARA
jgi:hypothetical protein